MWKNMIKTIQIISCPITFYQANLTWVSGKPDKNPICIFV